MAREPSRRFITNVVNFASKPWNVAGREVQELIRKILESDQEGRPAEHRLLDPISHQDTERADPTDGAVIRGDGTNWKVADKVTVFDEASAAGTYGFLNVTGTLPAVISAQVIAANALITSAGSSAFSQIALAGSLLAGYTGTSKTNAVSAFNTAAGTGTTTSGGIANYGVYSTTEAVGAGWNVGVGGYASNSTVRNVGGYFQASNSAATDAIGVHGRAQTATNNVGVLASTGSGIPSISGIYTAFLADNTDAAQPIAIFRDNETTVFSIQDGGGITVKGASLTSTTLDNSNHVIRVDATAGNQTFVLPAIATANRGIWYRIKKIDSSVNTVIISRTGADTIDGAASQTLTGQYESVDVLCPNTGTDWLTLGASPGIGAGIISGSGTLNTVPKWTPDGTTLGNSSITDDGTVVTVNGATTMRAVATGTTTGFTTVTGTLPTGAATGLTVQIASNAGATSSQLAFYSRLSSGATGDVNTYGGQLQNVAAATPTGASGFLRGNYGLVASATGAGTNETAVLADASNGTISTWGVASRAIGSGTTDAVGGYFTAKGGLTQTAIIGVLETAGANPTTPTSAAALFDNAAIAAPIAIFRDSGVETVAIEDGAAVSSTRGFLNVTGTLPTTGFPGGAFFNITTAGTANSQNGIEVLLKPGFTGSGKTMAGYFENTVLGTSTDIGNANVSVYSNTIGVGAGFGTGTSSQSSGSTVWNTGSYNQGGTGTGTTGLGGYFVGAGATNSIGLLATIGTGAQLQPALSAVAVLDNAAIAAPILIARNNGTPVLTVGNSTTVTGATTVFGHAASDGTAGFLNVTGTLPGSGTFGFGSRIVITSSNGSSGAQRAFLAQLSAGNTSAVGTYGALINNFAAGTATGASGVFSNANYGTFTGATAAGTNNAGIVANATNATEDNYAVIGFAGAGARAVGGYFVGTTGTAVAGVVGALATNVSIVSTAALFDNSSVVAPIAIFRDNGSTVFSIQDGGGITVKTAAVGSTTLDNGNHVITADATAGAVTYTLPAISATTRGIWYRIKKIDASANTVTIARTGADTIDGAVSQVITLQYQSIDIICPSAGTDWLTLGASSGLSAGSGTDDEARAMAFMAL